MDERTQERRAPVGLDVIDRLQEALDGNYLTAALHDLGADKPEESGYAPTYMYVNNRLRILGLKLTIVAIGGDRETARYTKRQFIEDVIIKANEHGELLDLDHGEDRAEGR
jgi:hypothetical protein